MNVIHNNTNRKPYNCTNMTRNEMKYFYFYYSSTRLPLLNFEFQKNKKERKSNSNFLENTKTSKYRKRKTYFADFKYLRVSYYEVRNYWQLFIYKWNLFN